MYNATLARYLRRPQPHTDNFCTMLAALREGTIVSASGTDYVTGEQVVLIGATVRRTPATERDPESGTIRIELSADGYSIMTFISWEGEVLESGVTAFAVHPTNSPLSAQLRVPRDAEPYTGPGSTITPPAPTTRTVTRPNAHAADEYQRSATKTAIFPGQGTFFGLQYAALELGNESGELLGVIKKMQRDGGYTPDQTKIRYADQQTAADELGDVMWAVAAVATELGLDLSAIMERNITKLTDRANRGVLGGSGDKR